MIPAVRIYEWTKEKAESSILKALIYFDIFNYPLSESEIKIFLNCRMSEKEFRSALHNLIRLKIIFRTKDFYSIRNDAAMIERRIQGNLLAERLLPKAGRIGAFIFRFPYVRSVAISGSLSKNYADKNADIDFFIITKTDRLWIARTLLHIFKKFTFLLGKQHYYCMNYFIDEKALLLQDQNVYSATEVVTLIPIAGLGVLNDFFEMNDWTKEWLPEFDKRSSKKEADKNPALKKILEKLFDTKWGDKIENFLFEWTSRRWHKKEILGRKNLKGKVMSLITDRHFSKADPGAFQHKIVTQYENKLNQVKTNWPQYFD
jgi:hypothetical protein